MDTGTDTVRVDVQGPGDRERTADTNFSSALNGVEEFLCRVVADSVRPVALTLAILFALFAAGHLIILPDPQKQIMFAIAAGTSLLMTFVTWHLGRRPLASRLGHSVMFAFIMIMLVNACAHLILMEDALQSTGIALLLVGTGFMLLRRDWYFVAAGLCITVWTACALTFMAPPFFVHFAFTILAAFFMGTVIHEVRYRTLSRLHISRQSERSASQRLQEAVIRAEEKAEQLRIVMGAAPVALVVVDPGGRVVFAEGSGLDAAGVTAEELSGQSVEALSGHVPGIRESLQRAMRGEDCKVIVPYADRWFDLRVSPIHEREGAISGAIAVAVDFTDRKAAADQLIAAKEAAESAYRTKSQFLATMSHELRTPLNAIIGYSELIQEDFVQLTEEEKRKDLHKIELAGQQLLAMINEILDLSKLEAGRVEVNLEEFGVEKFVEEIAGTVKPLAEKNGNRLRVETLAVERTLYSDRLKLSQCLLNLLANACKFTEDGLVTLNVVSEAGSRGSNIVFTVSDTGIGISPDALPGLFEPFTQADAGISRRFGGTGLGLAIAHRYCTLLGGAITVTSSPGHGSTFSICVPTICEPSEAA